MAKYGIPPPLINGFELLAALSETDIQSIISLIEKSELGEGVKSLSEKLSLETSINDNDSREIMRSLFSTLNIYNDSNDTVEKFAEDFINSYKMFFRINEESPKLDDLKNKLSKILPSFKSIKQTLKAKELIVQNPNNFAEAKIISDVRIVYDDDSEMNKKEQIAVLIHNLRITYSDGAGRPDKFFYVSLDLSDLGKLKEIVNRALEKDNLIRTNTHDLSFVDVQ